MKKDTKAFIFELNNMKFLPASLKSGQKQIGCFKKRLLYFKDAFILKDNCQTNYNFLISRNEAFGENIDIQTFLLGKTAKGYKVAEIEVF